MATPAFRGFSRETFSFLEDLAENNRRDWFNENRDRYEAAFLAPALAFVEAIAKPLDKAAPCLTAVPRKSGGSLMRIYKDTRFSKDKAPYKTNIGIHFRHMAGKDVHAPGVYVHIAADECFFGAGIWRPASDALKSIRGYIDANPDDWRKLHRSKRISDALNWHEDHLKSAPRGFAKDHPMLDELRRKSFLLHTPLTRGQVGCAKLVDEVIDLVRRSRPLMIALCEALQQPY